MSLPSSSYIDPSQLARNAEDKSYHCPFCQAAFTRRSNLRRHMIIHARHMPYMCPFCSTGFIRSDDFEYHIIHCDEKLKDSGSRIFANGPTSRSGSASSVPAVIADRGRTSVMSIEQYPSHLPNPMIDPYFHVMSDQDVDRVLAEFLSQNTEHPSSDAFQPAGVGRSHTLGFSTLDTSGGGLGFIPSPTSASPLHQPVRYRKREKGLSVRQDDEQPIYTHRQVEEMIGALSTSFAGKIEDVLKHSKDRNRKQ